MNVSTKMWNPRWDNREEIMREAGVDRDTLDRVLKAFFETVFTRPQTTIVGFARFKWTPYEGKLPDGTSISTRRLVVEPSRYCAQPAKDTPVTGEIVDVDNLEEI